VSAGHPVPLPAPLTAADLQALAPGCHHCGQPRFRPPSQGYEELGFDGPACEVVPQRELDNWDSLCEPPEEFHCRIRTEFGLEHDAGCPRPAAPRRREVRSGRSRIFEEIKAAARIEDVAGRLTVLRPSGRASLKGPCPFHAERTPSFVVYPESGRWRCYGACASGGDVVTLVAEALRQGVWR
jgi:hypothetical protein